eukprot:jgi/Tetstr1/464082/TSEL_008887.t1
MNSQMMFKVLLIVAAGIALVAIVMHYNSAMSGPTAYDTTETFESPLSTQVPPPDFTKPVAPGGPMGAEEDVYDVPAPVAEAAAITSQGGPGDAVKPGELLPRTGNTPEEQRFAQLYSTGQGDMQGINFLDAGSQVGLSTRHHRNANLQLRSDPPLVKQPLPMNFSTIEPDRLRMPLEIGSSDTAVPAAAY